MVRRRGLWTPVSCIQGLQTLYVHDNRYTTGELKVEAGDNIAYYMAGSASGQDESNPALWLATRAGKMELSCPLGITRCPSAWHRKFNPEQQCNRFFSFLVVLGENAHWNVR